MVTVERTQKGSTMDSLRVLLAGGLIAAAAVLGAPTATAQEDSHAPQCSSGPNNSSTKCQKPGDAGISTAPRPTSGGFRGGFYSGPYLTPYW